MANHEYEGNETDHDKQLTEQLTKNNIEFIRWHDQCILPPRTITTNDDSMYQVFTPFYKKWQYTLDVSSMQIHKAIVVNNNTTKLKTSKDSASTTKDIERLSKKVVADYQKQLQNNEAYQHINIDAQSAPACAICKPPRR